MPTRGGAAGDARDCFTFTLPAGQRLTNVRLLGYVDLPGGTLPGNQGFTAINAGATGFIPGAAPSASFLGITVGTGFTVPLGSGAYTYLVQQTGPQTSGYSLEFVVTAPSSVPAQRPWALALLGSARAARRGAGRRCQPPTLGPPALPLAARPRGGTVIDVCVRGGIILPMTPLQVRPGARFTCHADGLCCSDIHVLGPVEEGELVPLRPLGHHAGQRIAGRDASVKGWAFRVVDTGACPFLQADNLCRVHATLGPQSKPATCRLFPFYLVGTPTGVRVSTSHRCTCRSIGERQPLDPTRVDAELGMADRELPLAWSVPARLALDAERDVSFAEWTAREARLLEKLNAGNGLPALVGLPAFPALRNDSWEKIAARFCRPSDATGFEQAKAWIGEAIRAHVEGTPIVERPRPWARFLPRVAARTTPADSRDAILADWLGDELWGLGWTRWGSFEQARMDFSTRAAIVAVLESAFSALGTPGVTATAEAILVVDAIVHSPHWDAVARALPRRAPS